MICSNKTVVLSQTYYEFLHLCSFPNSVTYCRIHFSLLHLFSSKGPVYLPHYPLKLPRFSTAEKPSLSFLFSVNMCVCPCVAVLYGCSGCSLSNSRNPFTHHSGQCLHMAAGQRGGPAIPKLAAVYAAQCYRALMYWHLCGYLYSFSVSATLIPAWREDSAHSSPKSLFCLIWCLIALCWMFIHSMHFFGLWVEELIENTLFEKWCKSSRENNGFISSCW